MKVSIFLPLLGSQSDLEIIYFFSMISEEILEV